ncbi:hypothetical protein [Bradyrhizobium glycinis]|uniref:hypothetical protein n=1 Tax=Bradyrhizobium glycinis TaxID=2751812 RepID=UPI0035DFB86C
MPSWINEADIDFYGEQFKRSGFRGALNYYRNIDRNWEITGALSGLQVNVPALYIAGDRDFIVAFPGTDQLLANMKGLVPVCAGSGCFPVAPLDPAGAAERYQCGADRIRSCLAEPLVMTGPPHELTCTKSLSSG